VVWEMVDYVSLYTNPVLSRSAMTDFEKIYQEYFGADQDTPVSYVSAVQQNFARYNKPIIMDAISIAAGDTAVGNFHGIPEMFYSGQDVSGFLPNPAMQTARYKAAFELAASLKNQIVGVGIDGYAPWQQAAWISNPNLDHPSSIWNHWAKIGWDLYYAPDTVASISPVLLRGYQNSTLKYGNDRDNVVLGQSHGEILRGFDGNDILVPQLGNDSINGGSGTDTVVFSCRLSGAVFRYRAIDQTFIVEADGVDQVSEVEIFQFSDQSINAANLAGIGEAGQSFKVPVSREDLFLAYLAYFGRPPDPTGLQGAGVRTQDEIVAIFSESQESRDLFTGVSIPEQVNSIYRNLFGRDAEQAGLDYWANEIVSGRVSSSRAALTIQGAALNEDALTVAAKMDVMQAFVSHLSSSLTLAQGYSGNAAAAIARDFLASVKGTTASELEANKAIALANVPATVSRMAGSVQNTSAEDPMFQLTSYVDEQPEDSSSLADDSEVQLVGVQDLPSIPL